MVAVSVGCEKVKTNVCNNVPTHLCCNQSCPRPHNTIHNQTPASTQTQLNYSNCLFLLSSALG